MKKWLALSLAVVMLVCLMAACGTAKPAASEEPTASAEAEATPTASPAIPENTVTGDPSAKEYSMTPRPVRVSPANFWIFPTHQPALCFPTIFRHLVE